MDLMFILAVNWAGDTVSAHESLRMYGDVRCDRSLAYETASPIGREVRRLLN